MQVTDITGSIVLQRRLNAQNKQHTEQIQGDARWAAGVYYVRVFDAKNKLVSKSSFIVQ